MVQERTEFDEPDFALIDTLFSLAEAHLLLGEAQLAAAAAAALSVPARADLQAAGPNLSAIAGACRYRHHPWGLLPFMLSVAVYKQL